MCTSKIDFTELSPEPREQNLNKKIVFQGRKVVLKTLLCDQNSRLPDELLTDDCIESWLSQEVMKVGTEIPDFMQYCLPHRLQRQAFLRLDILNSETSSDVFAFTGTTVPELELITRHREHVGYADEPEIGHTRFLVLDASKAVDQYDELCRTRSSVHWLHMEDGKLEWKRSHSDMRTIRWNISWERTSVQLLESVIDFNDYDHDRVVLITRDLNAEMCDPLPYLAHKAKVKNSCMWIIHVRLDKDSEPYFQLSGDEFLILAARLNSPLEKDLFQVFLKHTGNIILLLDICYRFIPNYQEKCCVLLTRLVKTKIKKVVVTCHYSATNALETSLSTLAFTSVKFVEDDQTSFLHNYWSSYSPLSGEQLKELVENIRNAINALWILPCRDYPENVVIGITLQTAMIAEVFRDYVIDPKSNKLLEKLDVINLFQLFVDKKLSTTVSEDETKRMYMENHEHSALMNFINRINIQRLFKSKYHDIEMRTNAFLKLVIKYPEQSVFITGVIDDLPHFTHPMLAAYFAGNVLAKHYKSSTEFILEHFYRENFKVVRFMFDSILSKDCKLHTAVIHNNTQRVEELLKMGGVAINSTDRGGRTALHLAASLRLSCSDRVMDNDDHYGRLNNTRPWHMVEILLSHGARHDIKDSVLQWTPLEYTLKTTSWDAMEYLLASGVKRDCLILPKHLFNDIVKCVVTNGFVNIFTWLLELGLPVEFQIDNGPTLFHKACWYGHLEIVNLLISRGADRRVLEDGDNVLHIATERRHISVIKILLESPEKVKNFFGSFSLFQKYVHTRNSRGESALHIASRHGCLEIVKLLVSYGADVLTIDHRGNSSLHHACDNAHLDVARVTVESSREKRCSLEFINKLNCQGESAMRIAVLSNNPDITMLLLSNGADVESRDDKGKTLLHLACQYGYFNAVKVLMDSCKNFINTLDKTCRSPLHLATWAGHKDIVDLLILHGGYVWTLDSRGRTCFHLASWKGDISILRALVLDKELITSNINTKDKEGKTALHLASYWGYMDVIRFLIKHGASTREIDDDGRTCLHLTAIRGNLAAVEAILNILLDEGVSVQATINIRDETGKTALHLACYWGYSDIAQILISNGGDVGAIDDEGRTCLHWTAMRHEMNVAQILIGHYFGCDNACFVDYINVRDSNRRTAREVAIAMGKNKERRNAFVWWLDFVLAENSEQAESQLNHHSSSQSAC